MSDLLPCPKCYTREPPKCEWDRYDSCLSCVKCNYYTGWCYVPTAKDKWNEDAKASMEPDFGGPVFHCMDMDNLKEMLRGQTCWGTDLRCPKCGSTLNTNGRVLWCSFVGGREEKACDYGCDYSVPYND